MVTGLKQEKLINCAGHILQKPSLLFRIIEDNEIEQQIQKLKK